MGVCGTRGAVFLGNVLLSLLCLSECLQITLRKDTESVLCVSSVVNSCTLCTGNATSPAPCGKAFCANTTEDTTLQVICPEPLEKAFQADVSYTIECTKDSCSPATGVPQTSLLTQLPRTLSWGVETPSDTMVELTIVGDGLSESGQTGPCPDGPKYMVTQTGPSGQAQSRVYCRGGSITSFTLQNGSLALVLPARTIAPETVFSVSPMPLKGPTVAVTLGPNVTAEIRRPAGGPKCEVCTDKGASCSPARVLLSKAQTTEMEFGCLLPQEIFTVQLQRKIDCSDAGCVPTTGKVVPDQLADFQRTFLWDVSLPKRTALTLDFPAPGLTETTAEGTCQDGHKYSVSTAGSGGPQNATYCRGGAVTQLSLLGNTSLALEVPRGAELKADVFTATAAPKPGRTVPVSAAPHTHVTLTRAGREPACEVCTGEKCTAERLQLLDAGNTSVTFDCPSPQQLWTAEVNQEIDCTNPPCHRKRVQAQSALFPDFNRTFTWDLKVKPDQTIQMDFPEPWLKQVPHGETCPDGHTYSLVTYPRSGVVAIGTYCRGGAMSTILVPYKVRLVLQVPGDRALDSRDFELSVAPETNALVTVKVDLPRGVSKTSFMAAHYLNTEYFPSNQQMSWDFRVPGMHNYTVSFTNHRLPEECLSKRVELQYRGADGKVIRPGLADPQPRHKQGDFNMSLTNCETNQTLEGLALAFTVSVMRSGHPVLCTVDLTKNTELSLQIEKVGSDPYCEMSVDSVVKDKIRVEAGTSAKLSFLDCPSEDLRLTASAVIDSAALRGSKSQLTVPRLDACLPMALSSFTWRLLVPDNCSLDLSSPSQGGLRQSLPGQECNGSGVLRLTDGAGDDGHPIGTFCQQGLLKKVQVRANVSVTVETWAASRAAAATPFLNVTVTEEISEHIIYTVKPQILTPALLATPSWPDGMKPSSTVSWMVLVPDNYLAVVKFANFTKPTCARWHTSVKVQPMGSKEEIMSRREDQHLEDQQVSESFYLNMSNCLPEGGHFSALTKVTLQPKSSPVGIILGVLGAVLLLALVFTIVGLFLRRKKSNKAANTASIYISKGNIFRTGDAHFAKARSDNASHVYDSIDEAMVYGHLLRGSTYAEDLPDHFSGMQVDSYRTFVGPVDGEPAATDEAKPHDPAAGGERFQAFLDPADSFLPPRPRTPIAREESLGFQDRRMVDNELYTFKSTGSFNTIRLSGADQQDYHDDVL